MYNPSLQHLLVQAHINELHRSRQSMRPVTTMRRRAIQQRRRLQLSTYFSRAIERFVGQPAPEAYAF